MEQPAPRFFVPAHNAECLPVTGDMVKGRFDFNSNYGVVYVPRERKEDGSQTGTRTA